MPTVKAKILSCIMVGRNWPPWFCLSKFNIFNDKSQCILRRLNWTDLFHILNIQTSGSNEFIFPDMSHAMSRKSILIIKLLIIVVFILFHGLGLIYAAFHIVFIIKYIGAIPAGYQQYVKTTFQLMTAGDSIKVIIIKSGISHYNFHIRSKHSWLFISYTLFLYRFNDINYTCSCLRFT